jgi:hypothetical protein
VARRHVHYEAAFEGFLQRRGWAYVPVDEHRKAVFAGAQIKSFDFLVYPPGGGAWMVDVKGRKFPYDLAGGKHYWENWVTRADLEGLRQWETAFGSGFEPVLVFVYFLQGPDVRLPDSCLFSFRLRDYAFFRIPVSIYAAHARPRSAKWRTLFMPHEAFRRFAEPIN